VDPVVCPNCRLPLEQQTLEGLYGRTVVIDVCTGCQGIWFDEGESLQLSPNGTLTLFEIINARQGGRRSLNDRLECPRCGIRLSLAVDQQRDTKFQYHRCPRNHGRFITFFHFLRARNFVRNLNPREVADLRARVKQVNCSNCGAPIDLDKDVACSYCRAPISMLDPNQVKLALSELHAAAARRKEIDPALPLTLMMERLKTERLFAGVEGAGRSPRLTISSSDSGLVEAGLDLVLNWLSSHNS
jgi:Zn-finger nucleic acid-binding protein